jgi:protease II
MNQKKTKTINQHREEVLSKLSELNAYSKNMRDDMSDVKNMLREQNGRIRRNESSISKILGIGSAVTTLFTGIIAWLFNK